MGRDLKAQRQSQEGKGTKAIGWAQQLTSGQVPSKTTLARPQARAASGPLGPLLWRAPTQDGALRGVGGAIFLMKEATCTQLTADDGGRPPLRGWADR